MALDPAVPQARINLRVCELKLLAAWTAANHHPAQGLGGVCSSIPSVAAAISPGSGA